MANTDQIFSEPGFIHTDEDTEVIRNLVPERIVSDSMYDMLANEVGGVTNQD